MFELLHDGQAREKEGLLGEKRSSRKVLGRKEEEGKRLTKACL